jgi:nitrite reductase/ring-hydroxylating ferredoxin subunit
MLVTPIAQITQKFRWHDLVRVASLPPNRVLVRRVRGQLVGVAELGGQIHVFGGGCPHAGQSLQDTVPSADGTVECPRHGLKLALDESRCPAGSKPVVRLPFRVRDGVVEVDTGALRRNQRERRWTDRVVS